MKVEYKVDHESLINNLIKGDPLKSDSLPLLENEQKSLIQDLSDKKLSLQIWHNLAVTLKIFILINSTMKS